MHDVSFESNVLEEKMNDINYEFKEGITFCNGLSSNILRRLLFQELLPNEGYVALNKKGYVYDVFFVGDYKFNKSVIYDEFKYINDYYNLGFNNLENRALNSLKMVGLDDSFLVKYVSDLSTVELKRVNLALALFMNAKIIFLNYYEVGLTSREQNQLKRLLSKLSKMYNKTIIVCSNDISIYLDIVNYIAIFRNGELVFDGTNLDIYNDRLYEYIEMPEIVSFIKYAKKKKHVFDSYTDIKELLKAIYRDVENK